MWMLTCRDGVKTRAEAPPAHQQRPQKEPARLRLDLGCQPQDRERIRLLFKPPVCGTSLWRPHVPTHVLAPTRWHICVPGTGGAQASWS